MLLLTVGAADGESEGLAVVLPVCDVGLATVGSELGRAVFGTRPASATTPQVGTRQYSHSTFGSSETV